MVKIAAAIDRDILPALPDVNTAGTLLRPTSILPFETFLTYEHTARSKMADALYATMVGCLP